MATYNPSLKGYIADVPRVVFKRCDGAKFYMDELTAATVSANIDTMEINAGWSLVPVAVLPGASTFTMSFTSGKFDTAMFSMANAIKDKKEDEGDHAWETNSSYLMSTGERHTPNASHVITLMHTPAANPKGGSSVYIAGMEEASGAGTIATGTYKVDAENKTVTFSADDVLDFVDVVYDYVKEVTEAIVTNKESAIGEAVCIWPVYGSGDDCTESDIVGYYVVKVFRARITSVPGMDTSYKSAATFTFELQALDPKRNDEGAYSIAFFKK